MVCRFAGGCRWGEPPLRRVSTHTGGVKREMRVRGVGQEVTVSAIRVSVLETHDA